jgi:hypothetical protein
MTDNKVCVNHHDIDITRLHHNFSWDMFDSMDEAKFSSSEEGKKECEEFNSLTTKAKNGQACSFNFDF